MIELIQKVICTIGAFCFFFGGACLNSEHMLIPAVICLGGALLMLATYHAYKL